MWVVAVIATSLAADLAPSEAITAAITPIVDAMAAKYRCAVSVALKGGPSDALEVRVASGSVDRKGGRQLTTDDKFVWGSVTKLVTGTAILRLVDSGKLYLSDPVAPKIDPLLARMAAKDPGQGFTSLAELWGDDVGLVTVENLLHMHSGVPDYDTASPGAHPSDKLRVDSYNHPNHSYTPTQLLSLPWVRTGKLLFAPGTCERRKYYNCYSSTNFVLLGLLLASVNDAPTWTDYDQATALAAVHSDFEHLQFAVAGAPEQWTPVHGYDETKYISGKTGHDVSAVVSAHMCIAHMCIRPRALLGLASLSLAWLNLA